MYIHSYYSLSIQGGTDGRILPGLSSSTKTYITEPEYKAVIPSAQLRRMSKAVRMGVFAGLQAAKGSCLDGIVVGSGMGCYGSSLEFCQEYSANPVGAISPSAFIQSTDNTIAGQLGILLKNYGYNITHLHKGVAFETALRDTQMLLQEKSGKYLVGSFDEHLENFYLSTNSVNEPNLLLGEGAHFFVVSNNAGEIPISISCCDIVPVSDLDAQNGIDNWCKSRNLTMPDLVLYVNSFVQPNIDLLQRYKGKVVDVTPFSGLYFTNSAFALQLGIELLEYPKQANSLGWSAQHILVVNNFYNKDIGLTYLSRL